MSSPLQIPRYHLYGEVEPEDFDFCHIETIRARSEGLGWSLAPHSHAHLYQCLLVTGGGGHLVDDTGERPVSAGSLVFTPAGSVHGWSFTPDTEGYVVSFTRDMISGTGEAADFSPASRGLAAACNVLVQLNGKELSQMAGWFAALAQEFDAGQQRRAFYQPHLALILLSLFPDGQDSSTAAGPEKDRVPGFSLFRFRELVDLNFRTGAGTEFYAGEMGLSVARLNRYCRLFAGQTAAQCVRERVVIEAKRLLAFSDLSVAQVGYEIGFEDPGYFSRVFRKDTGESPQEFRARHGRYS